MNTDAPLPKPKSTMVKNHVHLPAMPTAASGASPSVPIISVSTSVKEEKSRFCSVTGTAMESIVRVKADARISPPAARRRRAPSLGPVAPEGHHPFWLEST